MQLRSLLLSSAILIITVGVIIGSIVLFATRYTLQISERVSKAEDIMSDVFELNSLTQEYLAHHGERPKVQWYARYSHLKLALADQQFSGDKYQPFIRSLIDDADSMKSSFDGLVDNADNQNLKIEREEQITSELLVTSRHMIITAQELSDDLRAERMLIRQRTDQLIFILLGVMAASAVVIFITFERKVEKKAKSLYELNQKNEIMLQSIGDGVVAIDTDWNIILWNTAATTITGWSKEEVMGRPFRTLIKFIKEHDRSENVLFISDAMLSGQVRVMGNHTLLVRKDGSEISVEDSAAPIKDENGKVDGVIIIFRDATKERHENLVKSSFSYASHQLRTPVTKALWTMQDVAGEKLASEVAGKVKSAINSLGSVNKLVAEIVDVSEMEQGTVVPKAVPTKIGEVIGDVVKSASNLAKEHRVKIAVNDQSPLPSIATDARLLTKALSEVLNNAIIYSPQESSVTITLSKREHEIIIEVTDHGVGIPEEQQGIVFTKFFRGSNISADSVGAGLGLYLAREYIMLLGGKIWYESKSGQGTTFYLSLPLS